MSDSLRQAKYAHARKSLYAFAGYSMHGFIKNQFYARYYELLQAWYEGRTKPNIRVHVPPQHGKSQGCSVILPTWAYTQPYVFYFFVIGYGTEFANTFSRKQKMYMSGDFFRGFGVKTSTDKVGAIIRDDGAYVFTTGISGQITGNSANRVVIDDPYKNATDAYSRAVREKVKNTYTEDICTRLINGGRLMLTFTRRHTEDIAGHIIQTDDQDLWDEFIFKSIADEESIANGDWRQVGEALCPERMSVENLLRIKKIAPDVFETIYQQNPISREGLLFDSLIEHNIQNALFGQKVQVDVADAGKDATVAVYYYKDKGIIYILDIYFSRKNSETTAPEMCMFFRKNMPNSAKVEQNGLGATYITLLKRILREKGLNFNIEGWNTTTNKKSKILHYSYAVKHFMRFPPWWAAKYPLAYRQLMNMTVESADKDDDLADVLCQICEIEFGSSYSIGF